MSESGFFRETEPIGDISIFISISIFVYSYGERGREETISSNWLMYLWRLCAQSFSHVWTTLCNPMDCSPPGSSVHGILQAILEWVAIPFSRGSSWPRDWVSDIAGRFFNISATMEAWVCRLASAKSAGQAGVLGRVAVAARVWRPSGGRVPSSLRDLSCAFSYGLPLIRWGPPMFWRAICFTQSLLI